MNPKSMHRERLLGHMDIDTREWTDGVLTDAARKVVREPSETSCWIICDGDVDPEVRTLQCSTLHYSTSQYSTVRCSTVHHIALQYITLHLSSILQYTAVNKNMLQFFVRYLHLAEHFLHHRATIDSDINSLIL